MNEFCILQITLLKFKKNFKIPLKTKQKKISQSSSHLRLDDFVFVVFFLFDTNHGIIGFKPLPDFDFFKKKKCFCCCYFVMF